MACFEQSTGYQSTPTSDPGGYNLDRPGGRDKFPMVRALAFLGLVMARNGLTRGAKGAAMDRGCLG